MRLGWLTLRPGWLILRLGWWALKTCWLAGPWGMDIGYFIPFYKTIEAAAQPVAKRHQMVSSSLDLLLFIGLALPLGSRAGAPIADKVL